MIKIYYVLLNIIQVLFVFPVLLFVMFGLITLLVIPFVFLIVLWLMTFESGAKEYRKNLAKKLDPPIYKACVEFLTDVF